MFTGNRERLRGMRIEGYTEKNAVVFIIPYYDSYGPTCTSDNAKLNGTSVCDDVILIAVNCGAEVQFVQIFVQYRFLTLCEVQVFAGKPNDN